MFVRYIISSIQISHSVKIYRSIIDDYTTFDEWKRDGERELKARSIIQIIYDAFSFLLEYILSSYPRSDAHN